MAEPAKQVMALTINGEKPIKDPFPGSSRLILGSSGAAKTTACTLPTIQSLLSNQDVSVICSDVKSGEASGQILPLANEAGRKFGLLDSFFMFGRDHPNQAKLNPFGAILSAYYNAPVELFFAMQSSMLVLVPEVTDGGRNKFWRDAAREQIECAVRCLLNHNPKLLTPGATYVLMTDPDTWRHARELATTSEDEATAALARQSLDLQERNPELFYQHHSTAISALRCYEPGSALHLAGIDADVTHAEIIRDGWLLFVVMPQNHAAQVGCHTGLHLQAFMHAQLQPDAGKAVYILDELCNAPLKELVDRVTIMRSYGASALYIAQSRKDIERKYGEREAAILEENCPIIQYLSFSHFEEAERVSRAMGESRSVTLNVGLSSGNDEFSSNFNSGKERVFTPDELMALPPTEQIIRIKGYGWLHCRKLFQNEIEPSCYHLGHNALEGGILPPNPKIWLPMYPGQVRP